MERPQSGKLAGPDKSFHQHVSSPGIWPPKIITPLHLGAFALKAFCIVPG
jgi:hypothetical protein